MKLTTILPWAALTAFASATCFDSGTKWDGDSVTASNAVSKLCDEVFGSGNGPVLGSWSKCLNLSSNKRAIFSIVNEMPDGTTYSLSSQKCKDLLTREIQGCEHGGSRFYPGDLSEYDPGKFGLDGFYKYGMRFTADPEDGNCA